MHLLRFLPFPILTLTPTIASNLAVVILLPFVHMFYRFLTRHNFIVYTYRRLVVGMLLASLSLLVAGATETARLQDIYQNGVSFEPVDLVAYAVAPKVKVYYQFIQYCFMGMSEIFFIATKYIYMKSPVHMQGLSMGLFWFSAGIGHVIGLAFTTIFGVTDNVNCLEYIYMKSPPHMQGLSMGLFWFSAGIGYFIGLALMAKSQVADYICSRYLDVYFMSWPFSLVFIPLYSIYYAVHIISILALIE
ncbi:SLC15A3 [Bugula neritina]|uniref:SLC15A3 n=1 Tax=Bugula neritina TaxID=10212 RepID=A0A7J7JPQ7_BUGNE|nr:SLC15A3 [Bugula neritina]